MGKRDITRTIISTNTIQHNLTSIFTDSIILKDNFEIAALSNGMADLVGYSHEELIEKPIDFLAHGGPIVYRLKDELQHGFFEKITLPLRTKNFGFVTCHLSGFYLGLISDLTGYIVLRVKPVDEINFLNRQLERSHQELDEFIYRASHDLRGPWQPSVDSRT